MSPLKGAWRWLHRLRAGIFGVVIVAFFLPFMTLSCTVQPLQTQISGIQLITGTQPSPTPARMPQIQPQPAAGIAFTAAWVGLTTSFLSPLSLGIVVANGFRGGRRCPLAPAQIPV